MALIKCPECGHEVSDKAVRCPNCGFPISHSTRPSNNYHLSENIQKLYTFHGTKSIATPIVAAIIIEIIVLTFLVAGFWAKGPFMIFAIIFAIVFEIMIPFSMIHDIKRINAINRMNGNCLCYDEKTKQILIMDNNKNVVFIRPLSNIIQFDGPKCLVISYRDDNNEKAKFVGGVIRKEKIIELRKLIGKDTIAQK